MRLTQLGGNRSEKEGSHGTIEGNLEVVVSEACAVMLLLKDSEGRTLAYQEPVHLPGGGSVTYIVDAAPCKVSWPVEYRAS